MRLKQTLKKLGAMLCAMALTFSLLPAIPAAAATQSAQYKFYVTTMNNGGDKGATSAISLTFLDNLATWDMHSGVSESDWNAYVGRGKVKKPDYDSEGKYNFGNVYTSNSSTLVNLKNAKPDNAPSLSLASKWCTLQYNKDIVMDPWMAEYLTFSYFDSDDLVMDYVEVQLPYSGVTVRNNLGGYLQEVNENNTQQWGSKFDTDDAYDDYNNNTVVSCTTYIGDQTKRVLTATGSFNSGYTALTLDGNSSASAATLPGSPWNNEISDQYGTYNPLDRQDPALYRVGSVKVGGVDNSELQDFFKVVETGTEHHVEYGNDEIAAISGGALVALKADDEPAILKVAYPVAAVDVDGRTVNTEVVELITVNVTYPGYNFTLLHTAQYTIFTLTPDGAGGDKRTVRLGDTITEMLYDASTNTYVCAFEGTVLLSEIQDGMDDSGSPAPALIMGDFDDSGTVNATDTTGILGLFLNDELWTAKDANRVVRIDMNGDGVVNVLDALLVEKLLANQKAGDLA